MNEQELLRRIRDSEEELRLLRERALRARIDELEETVLQLKRTLVGSNEDRFPEAWQLGAMERKMLSALMAAPGHFCTYERMCVAISGGETVSKQTMSVVLHTLRFKLKRFEINVGTIRNEGLRLSSVMAAHIRKHMTS